MEEEDWENIDDEDFESFDQSNNNNHVRETETVEYIVIDREKKEEDREEDREEVREVKEVNEKKRERDDESVRWIESTIEMTSPEPSSQDIYLYSVKIYPPPPSVLPREIFRLIFLPGVRKILESRSHQNLVWFDHGWRTKDEFEKEIVIALQSRTCNLDGIVIARKQTEEEAKSLINKINELHIRTCLVENGSPPLLSTAVPAPSRIRSEDMVIKVPKFSFLSKYGSPYNQEAKRHHVVLHLPPLPTGVQLDSDPCCHFVEKWYDILTTTLFCCILGEPDLSRGISRFTWPDRGWGNLEKFKEHTKESLKMYGHCLFAKKLNFHDAYVVYKRLENAGFVSSLIVTVNVVSASIFSSMECENNHQMSALVVPPSTGSSALCDFCQDILKPGEDVMHCDLCNYDLCEVCVSVQLNSPCHVLYGKNQSLSMRFPPVEAGDRIAPPEVPLLIPSHLRQVTSR